MKKTIQIFTAILLFNILSTFSVQAEPPHCEIPCGIYTDSLRIALIYEHIETIEKSMVLINKLSNQEKPDYNQLVRWVTNKEEHAKKIQEIVSQYFLHQRVKIKSPNDPAAYKKRCHSHHCPSRKKSHDP